MNSFESTSNAAPGAPVWQLSPPPTADEAAAWSGGPVPNPVATGAAEPGAVAGPSAGMALPAATAAPVAMNQPPVLGSAAAQPRRSATSLVLAVAAAVAVAGLAFAGGRLTAPTTIAATGLAGTGAGTGTGQGAAPGGFGGPGGGAAGALGRTIDGTVSAVSAGSITLTLTNGQTIEIPTDSSTTYHAQNAGSSSDVAVGGQVTVRLTGGAGGGPGGGGPAASPGTAGTASGSAGTASDITVVSP